ncbi:GNAT family N-acetyltransferase [Streptomyces sp. NPDC051453]|uniref:GNAT family N-acetyltransferase n=1 Tax=Streptomyces sp. NPDC051453 TaxID=3154941 RepID=UPI0034393F3D
MYLGERDGDVWLELVEVPPEFQRRGYGTCVLRWVVARASEQGIDTLLQVHRVNEDARRLYLSEGFSPAGENETHTSGGSTQDGGAPFPTAGTSCRVWWAPSRPPSTQAEPSRRGPWRPGRSYSGALHLDAMNHARSTDVWVDGGRDGSWGE